MEFEYLKYSRQIEIFNWKTSSPEQNTLIV